MEILLPSFRDRLLQLLPDIHATTIFVAFSGGKDSVTLLTLLSALTSELGFTLKAAYFNHGIRADAPMEAEWVSRFCADRSIPLLTEAADIPALARREGLNLEAIASHARYAFFSRLVNAADANWVATGHTLSDQVETFFMRLMRGSGTAGLSGIHPLRQKRIIRPLTIFSEADVRVFLKRRALRHYEDPSNHDRELLRNRLRHEILPALRRHFPCMDQRIQDTTRILKDEADFLQIQANRVLKQVILQGCILPPGSLDSLHPALQRHVLREYLRRLRGNLWGISLAHIEALMPSNSLRQQRLSLPGISLARKKGFLFPEDYSTPDYHHHLAACGEYVIPEVGAHIRIVPGAKAASAPSLRRERSVFAIEVDAQSMRFPLRVRSPRSSDRYRKQGSGFSQRVVEMVRAAGLPPPLRSLRPLFCDATDRPFWLPGHAPDADAAARTGHPFLEIQVSRIWSRDDRQGIDS